MKVRAAVVGGIVACVGVAAVALGVGRGASHLSRVARALAEGRQAVERWQAFPLDANPRSLVLRGRLRVRAPDFFPTKQAAAAFWSGEYVLGVALPSGTPGGAGAIPAASAYAEMRARTNQRVAQHQHAGTATRLVIVAVRYGTGVYDTDRGVRTLPAWRFFFRGVPDPAIVIAVRQTRAYQGRAMRTLSRDDVQVSDEIARVSASGRTVSVGFFAEGSKADVCASQYAAYPVTNAHAVAIAIADRTPIPASGIHLCELPAPWKQLTVHLSDPLGNRVLISAQDAGVIQIVDRPVRAAFGVIRLLPAQRRRLAQRALHRTAH